MSFNSKTNLTAALARSGAAVLAALALAACPLAMSGCEEDTEVGENMEEAAEETGEAFEEGAEETGEAIEEGAEEMGGG